MLLSFFLSFFLFFFFSYTLSCREVHAGFGEARIVLAGACICLICVAPDAAKPVNHLPHLPQHNPRPHRGPSSIPHLFMPRRRCATSRVRTSPGEVFFGVTRPPLLARASAEASILRSVFCRRTHQTVSTSRLNFEPLNEKNKHIQ